MGAYRSQASEERQAPMIAYRWTTAYHSTTTYHTTCTFQFRVFLFVLIPEQKAMGQRKMIENLCKCSQKNNSEGKKGLLRRSRFLILLPSLFNFDFFLFLYLSEYKKQWDRNKNIQNLCKCSIDKKKQEYVSNAPAFPF